MRRAVPWLGWSAWNEAQLPCRVTRNRGTGSEIPFRGRSSTCSKRKDEEVVPPAVEVRRRSDAGSGGILLGGCDSSDGLVERDA